MADLAVRGGLVYTALGWRRIDLLITDGRLEALVEPGDGGAGEEVDAAGLWVLPGAVDAHVHSREPGFPEKEDWASLTAAAAAGGVTTVVDMPNSVPCVDRREVFEEKVAIAGAKACVDFALWGIARSSSTPEQIAGLLEAGAVGLKAYLGYSIRRDTGQVLYVPDGTGDELEPPPRYQDLISICRELARHGRPLAAHAEDPAILREHASEVATYADLLASRPDFAEAQAVRELGKLARYGGLEIRIVHLASAAGLEAALEARGHGARLSLETCPQYLWLTDVDADRLGPVMKMFPLVRSPADRSALRVGLVAGVIESVGTDHAPHTDSEKLGVTWSEAAAGAPGVQTLYLSCLELARAFGKPEMAVRWAAESPAGALGVYPQKGSIEPGADADLVLVDPDRATQVTAESMASKQRHSVFEGRTFGFSIRSVYLRGRPVGQMPGRLVRPARS